MTEFQSPTAELADIAPYACYFARSLDLWYVQVRFNNLRGPVDQRLKLWSGTMSAISPNGFDSLLG